MPNTDNYDLYNSQGVPSTLPGTPIIDEQGHLVIPSDDWISPGAVENSTMDKDPNNTGPMTDFWSAFPITIDESGFLFYYNENTGINVRGPEGAPRYVSYDELTEEEKQTLKGQDGADGLNGRDGVDGIDGHDGLDAYHVWLRDQGYDEEDHPIEEFYEFIAGYAEGFVKEGAGQGSLIVNYKGQYNAANGNGSFASGYETTAGGNYSFTGGLGTQTGTAYQFAIGKYNENDPNNVFEIGYGSQQTPSTVLFVTKGGRLKTLGNIEDGTGNVLSNKVDKVAGKGLSTNDFTTSYKQFLDNYNIETSVLQHSENPVTSAAIYTAIEQAKESVSSKPTIEEGTLNSDFPILSYRSIGSDELLDVGIKMNQLLWNPNKNVLKGGSGLSSGAYSYNILFGSGLVSGGDNQIILGKYNESNSSDLFQLGYGSSVGNEANVFTVSRMGDVLAAGDITDGDGNVLSGKQDLLDFDLVPTLNSEAVMTSDAIYRAFTSVGITPYVGITIPQLQNLQDQIDDNAQDISIVSNNLNNLIDNLYMITDDVNDDVYKLGIKNGQLYIQKIEEEVVPEEEEEEEGEDE